MAEIELKVGGMTCGGCVNSVTRVLQALPGVERVAVSLERGAATVTYDPARVARPAFQRAIEDAGFELQ